MIVIAIIVFFALSGFLTWYLLSKDKGEREPTGPLWGAIGFGVLAVILAMILEAIFLPDTDQLSKSHDAGQLFAASMGVGIIEELCKYLPLAAFIYQKRYFYEDTDGILYFALAGIGFGLPEDVIYTLDSGATTGFVRALLGPFFHSVTTATVGYVLIRSKLSGKGFWAPLPVLLLMMFVHGLYDFGVLYENLFFWGISLVITVGLTIFIFKIAARAKVRDQQIGLSVVGVNAFCRACGAPNPKRSLYCTRCGRHA